jgi:hypothetical protein
MYCVKPHAIKSQGEWGYLTELCVGPRAGLDAVEGEKIALPIGN